MPIEFTALKGRPEPYAFCSYCGLPLESGAMRGLVQSGWRKLFHMPYCAIICDHCYTIIGYEKPLTG